MFVIISYVADNQPETINFLVDEETGQPLTFGSEKEAEKEAEKECSWNYKVVEL